MLSLIAIQADDSRTTTGELQADPQRFPDGMPAMVSWLHGQGFNVSLYTSLVRRRSVIGDFQLIVGTIPCVFALCDNYAIR